jgi:hypothetical protein
LKRRVVDADDAKERSDRLLAAARTVAGGGSAAAAADSTEAKQWQRRCEAAEASLATGK